MKDSARDAEPVLLYAVPSQLICYGYSNNQVYAEVVALLNEY